MAIGERIRFLRNLRGMTQKHLGVLVGFPEKSADVRLAQYETGTRTPKVDLTEKLAFYLDVSPSTLNVPDIDSYVGLMHTLFTLEDTFGVKVDYAEDDVCLRVDLKHSNSSRRLHEMLCAWQEQSAKFKAGEITKEEYDRWRYRFPEFDTSANWVKTVPKSISDLIVKKFGNG